MNRLFARGVLLVSLSLASGVANAATVAIASGAAPLDQYFGPMKLSALGIRNRVDVLGRRYHARTITDTDLVHDASLAETSLDAWQRAFPRDPWIVPTMYHLEQLYQAVQSTNARSHATGLLHVLVDKYPSTPQAHASRARLAQGFPPLHAETATHATPNPYASEAAGNAASSPSASPVMSPAPSPTPS